MPTPKPKRPGRRPDPRSKRSLKIDRHLMPRIVLHLPQSLYDWLESWAEKRHGCNRSEAVREILAEKSGLKTL